MRNLSSDITRHSPAAPRQYGAIGPFVNNNEKSRDNQKMLLKWHSSSIWHIPYCGGNAMETGILSQPDNAGVTVNQKQETRERWGQNCWEQREEIYPVRHLLRDITHVHPNITNIVFLSDRSQFLRHSKHLSHTRGPPIPTSLTCIYPKRQIIPRKRNAPHRGQMDRRPQWSRNQRGSGHFSKKGMQIWRRSPSTNLIFPCRKFFKKRAQKVEGGLQQKPFGRRVRRGHYLPSD